jgi:hypothetical protein
MKLYVYCVAESLENLVIQKNGLENQKIGVLNFEDLAVVITPFSGDAVSVTRENVIRHDEVVRSVFASAALLPFRFGTLSTESSLKSYIAARHEALRARLQAVRDSVEMNVKVIWKKSGESSGIEENAVESGPGTDFLRDKQRALRGIEMARNEADEIAAWLNNVLADVSRDSRVNVEPNQKLVYSGAYLVEDSAVSEFREIVHRAKSERPDLHFLVSGPWPPYTFADIDLEFKSQFGVS